MPPKVTDTRAANTETLHAVEAETAQAAQRIVATYSEDFLDATTLMCMLGVEPEGLIYRKVAAEFEEKNKVSKKGTKRGARKGARKSTKATKKTTKKSTAKKTTKKSTKKAATKKSASKATKKATKKTTKKA